MFDKLKTKELKALIQQYKKHMYIPPYSKLKKKELVEMLNNLFEIHNGQLTKKTQKTITQNQNPPTSTKTKKRITPQLISSTIPIQPIHNAFTNNNAGTDGVRYYRNVVDNIEKKYKNK